MNQLQAKVVILGSQNVGKSTLIKAVLPKDDIESSGEVSGQASATIGASFSTCLVKTDSSAHMKLQIWDTAGQERFRSMAPMYYRNANAAMIVYDLTNYATFEAAKSWVTELKRNLDVPIVILIVGNKCDLAENRAVSREEAEKYSAHISAIFCETSAITEEGVDAAFVQLASSLAEYEKAHSNFVYKTAADSIDLSKTLANNLPKSSSLCCKLN